MINIFSYLQSLLGSAPPGFAFLEYIFAFVLLCFAMFLVYKLFEAFFHLF